MEEYLCIARPSPIKSSAAAETREQKRTRSELGFTTGYLLFEKVGDTGSEYAPETLGTTGIPGIGEAESEALSNDAALRSVVQAWSTLDQPIREAIALLARQGKGGD